MGATYRRSDALRRASKRAKGTAAKLHHPAATTESGSNAHFFTPSTPEAFGLYTFIEDWNRGVIPPNASLIAFLEGWSRSSIFGREHELSPSGVSLLHDMRRLIDLLMQVIKERNGDELIQKMIGHLRLASHIVSDSRAAARSGTAGPRSGVVTLVDDAPHHRRISIFGRRNAQVSDLAAQRQSRGASKDGKELFSLLQLIVTSSDFRQIVTDVQGIVRRVMVFSHGKATGGQAMARDGRSAAASPHQAQMGDAGREEAGTPAAAKHHTALPNDEDETFGDPTEGNPDVIAEDLKRLERRISETTEAFRALKSPAARGHVRSASIPTVTTTTTTKTTTSTEANAMGETNAPLDGRATTAAEEGQAAEIREDGQGRAKGGSARKVVAPARPPGAAAAADGREEQWRQILTDAKVFLDKIARNKEFSLAFRRAWSILSKWNTRIDETISGVTMSSDVQYDANFAAAQKDVLELMRRFASNVPLEPLIRALKELRARARSDYELADFIHDWAAYMRKCSSSPAYLSDEEYYRRGKFLLDRTVDFADAQYGQLIEGAINSWHAFVDGWNEDLLTAKVGNLISRIVNEDIFASSAKAPPASSSSPHGEEDGRHAGRPSRRGLLNLAAIQSGLVRDLRHVLIPEVLKGLYELPLPHLLIEDGGMKISLDDIVIPASLFAPAHLDVYTKSAISINPRDRLGYARQRRSAPAGGAAAGGHHHGGRAEAHNSSTSSDESVGSIVGRRARSGEWRSGAHLAMSGMRGDINGVQFALDRTDWPRLRDSGVLDLRLGGKGISIVIDVESEIDPAAGSFHMEPVFVKVTLDRVRLKFHHVLHENLFAIGRAYVQMMIKSRLEDAIRDRIVEAIRQVDAFAKSLAISVSLP